MVNDIPQDELRYKKLVQKVSLRLFRSATWSDPTRMKWVRMYKWWRKISDLAQSNDEYAMFLGYAFGLVEQINAKITEPMLQMGIPFGVFPTQTGDGQKAENFAQICRNWYSKPNNQSALRKSKKEMIITGNRWEVDEWVNLTRKGLMWGKVPKKVQTPVEDPNNPGNPLIGKDGRPVTIETTVMVDAEVPADITTHYGFNTRYPSVFNMFPEPDRPTIGTGEKTDCSWLIEDMGELTLEELAKEFYTDPTTKASVPVYDFSRLVHAAGKRAEERYKRIMQGGDSTEDKFGPLITPIRDWNYSSDWGRINKDTVYPTEGTVDRASSEDRDKIWVCRMHEADQILTIANGRFIIQRLVNPYHVPGIKARIENYTTDPEFIYGPGAIEPIEDELNELNDIRSLSMDNWFRIINKMVYVREDAIINWDDFKARAGGKVRISSNVSSIGAAVQDASQMNVTSDMLAAESNERGMIEFISSNLDMAPGVSGTKSQHKTARGMELIQMNTNTRFVTMQAQALINECNRGRNMQDFFNQFAFEKRPFRIIKENGTTAFASFNKDDIFTEGRPFELAIEVDPLWGNSAQQRQDSIEVFERGVAYEQFRATAKDPGMRKVNLDILFENLLRKSGYRDTSRIFAFSGGEVSPEDELQILMQGGIAECRGDLMKHIEMHLLQLKSPQLKQAVESGQAHPDTIKNLQLLIQQAMAKLITFVRDPEGAALQRLNQLGLTIPGAPQGAPSGPQRPQ